MTVLLLQASEEASKGFAYKLGYSVGYAGANYFWEILTFIVVLIAASVYLFIKKRKARKSLEEL